MISKLCELAIERGTVLSSSPRINIVEVATASGVYFAHVWQGDDDQWYVASDVNGELIEQAEPGIMLDIGAHVGRYTIPMATKATKVYAFEPNVKNFAELENYTKHLTNVERIRKAVSNQSGKAALYLNPRRRLMHTLVESKAIESQLTDVHTVQTITIDEFCKDIHGITAIKIDVEGAEQQVLEGAVKTLKREHALLALETHSNINCVAVYKLLDYCGYSITANAQEVDCIIPDCQYLCRKK